LDVDRIKAAVNAALGSKRLDAGGSGGDVSVIAVEMPTNSRPEYLLRGFGGGWGWRRLVAEAFWKRNYHN